MNPQTAILKSADLNAAEKVSALIAGLPRPDRQPRWVWLAAPDGWTLDFLPSPEGSVRWYAAHARPKDVPLAEVLPRAEEGRVFDPSGELRFRRLPHPGGASIWRAVFLGDEEWFPDWGHPQSELGGLRRTRTAYYLWGEQTPQTPREWVELQIPHRFDYPMLDPNASRVTLEVELWCDPSGRVHFQRFCGLRGEGR